MWIRHTEQRDSLEILIKLEHVYRDTFPSGHNWERIWGWKINTNIHQPVKWKQAPLPGRGLAYSWPYREEYPVTRGGGGFVIRPTRLAKKKRSDQTIALLSPIQNIRKRINADSGAMFGGKGGEGESKRQFWFRQRGNENFRTMDRP